MDFIKFIFCHLVEFTLASIPFILIYLLYKKYILSGKGIIIILTLYTLPIIYFLIKGKNLYEAIYFGIPLILSYCIVISDLIVSRIRLNKNN